MKTSKIKKIELIGTRETIDIEVDTEHHFFANGIYTHNSGNMSSDLELTDVSDSFGTVMTADLVIAMMENDDLKREGRYLIKMLKSRLGPIHPDSQKFLIGVNKEKQQIFEIQDPSDGLGNEDYSNIPTPKKKKLSNIDFSSF